MDNKNTSIIKSNENFIIYQDYCDFALSDTELNHLYFLFKKSNLYKSQLSLINSHFSSFMHCIKNNLTQMMYPYLLNSVNTFLSKIPDITMKNYFLIILLGNIKDIHKHLKSFFFNIIKITRFGIPDKLKSIFPPEVLDSKEFESFSKTLAKWYTHSEFIMFYIDILNSLYGEQFEYISKDFSIENNYQHTTSNFAKKNIFKLSRFICEKATLGPNVDYGKIVFLLSTCLTCGINLRSIILVNSNIFINLAGALSLNFIMSKLAQVFKKQSDFTEFRALAKIVHKLNRKLNKIKLSIYDYIKMKMIEEFNVLEGNNTIDNNKKNIKDKMEVLSNKICKYLSNVELDEESTKKIEHEVLEMSSKIINEESNNDWVVMYIKKNN